MAQVASQRVTLRTLRRRVREQQPFAMLTCYDATTARWLWRGGVDCLLVGDTAAQMILGHDSTLPVKMPFMVELTAAVRRGAPDAFVMADMPFGSYHCGQDTAMRHAVRFMADGGADAVKLEAHDELAPLIRRMALAGIPVVAHLGSRPQQVRSTGGYQSAAQTPADAERLLGGVELALHAGASMLLLEAVPAEVSQRVVERAEQHDPLIPVIGCGAGPACHGHVVVLQDLLGLSEWQPPFAPPLVDLGRQVADAAAAWAAAVHERRYLAQDHPYPMRGDKPAPPDARA